MSHVHWLQTFNSAEETYYSVEIHDWTKIIKIPMALTAEIKNPKLLMNFKTYKAKQSRKKQLEDLYFPISNFLQTTVIKTGLPWGSNVQH